MVQLRILRDGLFQELRANVFLESIMDSCEKHRKENRALAFAFILYGYEDPQIFKILKDENYWNALNEISGRYLSVYYIHYEVAEKKELAGINICNQRGLFPVEGIDKSNAVLPNLQKFLKLEQDVKIPSILFFQVEEKMISDYFFIELFEEKIEDGFIELKTYIKSAVDRLKMIDSENYCNLVSIFESLKQNVQSTKFRRILFGSAQKFPINLLVSWFLGKV